MTNRQKLLQDAKELITKIPMESREALAKAIQNNVGIVDLELLGYPQRYVNSLEDYGIDTIEKLMNVQPESLFDVPQFGDAAFIKLYECLAKFNELEEIYATIDGKVTVKKSLVNMQ